VFWTRTLELQEQVLDAAKREHFVTESIATLTSVREAFPWTLVKFPIIVILVTIFISLENCIHR
jgi:hypothetical protein